MRVTNTYCKRNLATVDYIRVLNGIPDIDGHIFKAGVLSADTAWVCGEQDQYLRICVDCAKRVGYIW